MDAESEPDFDFFRDGFIKKFRRRRVLAAAMGMFEQRGYRVVRIDAAPWTGEADMHASLDDALDFPTYYGRNFDALNDCLGDVAQQSYGWSPVDTGLVIVVDNIDRYWSEDPTAVHLMFDIFSNRAQEAALYGNRLTCLVRADDPWFDPKPVGANVILWNRVEWLDRNRLGKLDEEAPDGSGS